MSDVVKTNVVSADLMQKFLLTGDLKGFTPEQKIQIYLSVCEQLGLNPATRPLQIIMMPRTNKEILYAAKDCTDQLRKIHGVSVTSLKGEQIGPSYIVTVSGQDKTGRCDVGTGAVPIEGLKGDDFANAMMKAETKAKRRMTLSICGMGILDESELDTVKGAIPVEMPDIKMAQPAPDPREDEIRKWAASGLLTSMDLSQLKDEMSVGGEWAQKAFDKWKKTYETRSAANTKGA